MARNANEERFERLLEATGREGVDGLIGYARSSDFYTAPASTRYHGAHEGGLLEHSLNVYDALARKKEEQEWEDALGGIPWDSITIIGLLHDLCKADYYGVEMRNRKVDGRWEQYPFYVVRDQAPYGHGEKSVMVAERFIKLTAPEMYAIRWHMGPYGGQQDWSTFADAVRLFPVCLAAFEADMEATYLAEGRE